MNLDELERLAREAHEAEWAAVDNGMPPWTEWVAALARKRAANACAEFRFIAAANPATVLALIAEVKRLRASATRVLEWRGINGRERPLEWSLGNGQCPFCLGAWGEVAWGREVPMGHTKDCLLAELKEAASE